MTLYPHLVQKHSEILLCAKQMGCMTDGGLNCMCREHAWAACRVGRNRRQFSAPHIACRHLCRIATFCRLRGCSAKGPNESSQQYYWWRYHEALSVLPGAPELSSDWIRTLSGSSACEQSQYGGKLRCSLQSWKWLHVHCRASTPCMVLMNMLCQSTYKTSLSSLHILPVLSLGCVGKAFA